MTRPKISDKPLLTAQLKGGGLWRGLQEALSWGFFAVRLLKGACDEFTYRVGDLGG